MKLRITILLGTIGLAGALWVQAKERSVEEPTTVVGVRGLDKENGAGQTTSARDYPAIDRLEQVKVSAEELEAFRKSGHLDE